MFLNLFTLQVIDGSFTAKFLVFNELHIRITKLSRVNYQALRI